MKIDLNFALLDLSGKEIPDSNGGKLLGNILVSGHKGDALKYYGWAVKLHAGDYIEVDKSDLSKIKEFVNDSEGLTILSKAQILDKLSEVKE